MHRASVLFETTGIFVTLASTVCGRNDIWWCCEGSAHREFASCSLSREPIVLLLKVFLYFPCYLSKLLTVYFSNGSSSRSHTCHTYTRDFSDFSKVARARIFYLKRRVSPSCWLCARLCLSEFLRRGKRSQHFRRFHKFLIGQAISSYNKLSSTRGRYIQRLLRATVTGRA